MFEYALIELNKVQAPSLLLEDYNYFINKAVNQYINKVYNLYDINQQKSDDIRVLKSSVSLIPNATNEFGTSALYNKTYEVDLPDDYLHILNCVAEYQVKKNYKCYDSGDSVHFGVTRLTADMFSQIINNYYMRPSYKQPYFYVNNVNINNTFPTSDSQSEIVTNNYVISRPNVEGTFYTYTASDKITITKNDGIFQTFVGGTDFTDISTLVTKINSFVEDAATSEITANEEKALISDLKVGNVSISGNIDLYKEASSTRVAEARYGNKSKVRMEIRYGKDDSLFTLTKVYVDYLKAPQFIRLTQEQVDKVEDTSQVLEFPDYVCQEIVNELILLLMENASDPRLQTHIPINQSIANPAQEQQQQKR